MWPPDLDLVLDGYDAATIPFHANTQPGPGLTLYARDLTPPMEALFTATLTAVAENGAVHRRIIIPVKVLPFLP